MLLHRWRDMGYPRNPYQYCSHIYLWGEIKWEKEKERREGERGGKRRPGSISPTSYVQLLLLKDPKSAKRQSSHQHLYAFLGSMCIKAASKHR